MKSSYLYLIGLLVIVAIVVFAVPLPYGATEQYSEERPVIRNVTSPKKVMIPILDQKFAWEYGIEDSSPLCFKTVDFEIKNEGGAYFAWSGDVYSWSVRDSSTCYTEDVRYRGLPLFQGYDEGKVVFIEDLKAGFYCLTLSEVAPECKGKNINVTVSVPGIIEAVEQVPDVEMQYLERKVTKYVTIFNRLR